ncbi:MAG: hypothetical protein AAGE94_24875, partial [Acidobacteriota bacterium]
ASSLARAHLLHGDWLADEAPSAARAAWRRAVDAVAALAVESADPALLAPWAAGRVRLDAADGEARALIASLYRTGYRSAAFIDACRRAGIEPGPMD